MKGIEKITAAIDRDTTAEIEALRAETESRCAEIKEKYSEQAREIYRELVEKGKKDSEERSRHMDSAAELEAKKSVLAMKQDMVSRAFDLAVERVCALPEEDYVAFLARQASEAAQNGFEELVFNERDRAAVGKKVAQAANKLLSERGLPGKLTVSELTRDMRGGVLVKQGDIEANCSVEAIAASLRGELASQVAAVMF